MTKLFTGVVSFLLCVLFCSCHSSVTGTRSDKMADKQIQSLQDEIGELRRDIKLLNKDVRQVLVDVRIIKGSRLASTRTPTPRAAANPTGSADTTVYDIDIGSSPILGPRDAPVTIVEFSDFECVYCAREYPTIRQAMDLYPGKVRLVFKHFPLSFHKKAKPAHVASEYALREGGDDAFWYMHDRMIANPTKIDLSDLRGYLAELELDLGGFDKIVADSAAITAYLTDDFQEARKCQVRGTPTVLINGVKLSDRSINSYKTRIDQILAAGSK
ncbi:MAG: DsbA family protein [Planctomycetes bacterium]|nr:DsbA family protein [Planctomycetota bacterium]